jgi:hypothetical protein
MRHFWPGTHLFNASNSLPMKRRLKKDIRLVGSRGKFSTMKELGGYFKGDRLTCLLCGKRCVQLVAHILPAHGLSADDYREMFGIPWTYGLAGKSFRQRSSRRMKALRRIGKLPPAPSPRHIRKMLEARRRRRPPAQAVRDDSLRKLLKLHGRKQKWARQDFEEFLRRVALGRTPAEVGSDKDMPGAKWFHHHLKENAALAGRFRKVWDNLPYAVQVRAAKLGEKFQRDVIRLRRRDLTWGEVASALGVSADAARSTWHRLKKRGALTARDLAHER